MRYGREGHMRVCSGAEYRGGVNVLVDHPLTLPPSPSLTCLSTRSVHVGVRVNHKVRWCEGYGEGILLG